jgi:hypothetical protein
MRLATFSAVAICAAALAASPLPAGAAGATNRVFSGYDGVVSCLSTVRCVVGGYDTRGVGNVVVVTGGVPGHVSTVAGSQGIFDISCPNATGCVALARTSDDEGADFLTINAEGVVTGSKKVATQTGDVAEVLSCVTLTDCETAGLDVLSTPEDYQIGSWNGSKLVEHRIAAPRSSDDTTVTGISCKGPTCDVVGYIQQRATETGISIKVTGGTRFALHTVGHDSLYAVSCASASVCYADGFDPGGGVIVKLTNGLLGASTPSPDVDLFGIACANSDCTAGGKELATSPSSDAYWGAVLTVVAGAITSTATVEVSSGFEDVSRVGNAYAAVGLSQGAGSEVTTG